MGACCYTAQVQPAQALQEAQAAADSAVAAEHDEWRKREENHYKILLLGAGESGKSTVVKQLKMFYQGGISYPEREEFRANIRRNTVECMNALVHATDNLLSGLKNPDSKALADRIMDIDITSTFDFGADDADCIAKLWADPDIQAAYQRRNEFWMLDAAPYYFQSVHRIAEEDYVPSDEDTLMTRVRTTGIVETHFSEHNINYTIVDVGGQRNERRKWIHCFDDVKAIIFLCGLCEYNQVMYEDVNTNRMHESLNLFAEVCGNELFRDTPIFLFLNKKDVFEEMIRTTDLSVTFPDYKGGCDAHNATQYIREQFLERFNEVSPGKEFHCHILSARVRMDMKIAFGEVKDVIKAYHAKKQKKRWG
mmetsp:Transcript_60509/g.146164  ORF Transcript_60509/g.146164 Transcript_60509/m.146164 type:complete len:365 (-) Transcript_60509:63-1157(-)